MNNNKQKIQIILYNIRSDTINYLIGKPFKHNKYQHFMGWFKNGDHLHETVYNIYLNCTLKCLKDNECVLEQIKSDKNFVYHNNTYYYFIKISYQPKLVNAYNEFILQLVPDENDTKNEIINKLSDNNVQYSLKYIINNDKNKNEIHETTLKMIKKLEK